VDGSAFSLYGRPSSDPSVPLEKVGVGLGLGGWHRLRDQLVLDPLVCMVFFNGGCGTPSLHGCLNG